MGAIRRFIESLKRCRPPGEARLYLPTQVCVKYDPQRYFMVWEDDHDGKGIHQAFYKSNETPFCQDSRGIGPTQWQLWTGKAK